MKLRNFRRAVFCSVAIGALSATGLAYAQTADTEETTVTEEEDEAVGTPVRAPVEGEARQERVVVTGSLLRRDEFTSAAPIQVITAEIASLEGLIDTADVLQGASVAAGSTQINSQFGGFVVEGGPGVNTVSLRGLGAQRTLVVFNGRRLGPAGVQGSVGAVDLNVIPQSAVQRYEILKDGASSIYGSDAVAGVINVITRGAIDKPEITIRANAPFEGGAEAFSIDGAFGFNFDRGNINFSASYDRNERMRYGDRSYTACSPDYMFDLNSNERVDITALTPSRPSDIGNPRCNNPVGNRLDAFGPNFRAGVFANHILVEDPNAAGKPGSQLVSGFRLIGNDNQFLGRSVLGDLTGFREQDVNDPRTRERDILPQVQRFSLYSTAALDIGNGQAYGELLYNRRETQQRSYRQFFPTIFADHPFAAGFGPVVAAPGGPAIQIAPNIFANEFTPVALVPFNTDVNVDYYHGVVGYGGNFGPNASFLSGWDFDVHASYSRSDGTYDILTLNNNNIEDEFQPGGDVFHSRDANGNLTCTRISTGESCFVVNYLTPNFIRGQFTPQEFDFLFSQDKGKTVFDQKLFNALMTGELFAVPAGNIGAAVGVQYREVSIDDLPGELSRTGESWGLASAQQTKGSDKVWETFAELEVPIVRGQPFFEDLTFNGSIRYFDYEAFGSDYVYKLGLNWQINPLLRARSTFGTSFRAPALFERFLANQTGFSAQNIDPCRDWGLSTNDNLRANCAADGIPADFNTSAPSLTVIRGGGATLEPETSESFTAGLVFTPSSVNLSLALDYFEIEVNDQIAVLGASNILAACYGRETFPNQFCDLIRRNRDPNSSQFLTLIDIQNNYVNINSQSTRGLDATARYEHEFDIGRLTVDFQSTWTFEDRLNVFGGLDGFVTDDFNSTIGDPNFVGNSNIQFRRGDWTYSWFSNAISRSSNEKFLTGPNPFTYNGRPNTWRKRYAETTIYHGASVRYRSDDWQVILGVSNIFGEEPPAISSGAGSSRVGISPIFGTQYDLRGRAGFVQVSKAF
ncbi:TonB-dependent receptor domain-containing protein [Hyphomonas sp.]|uniref:TonB-dependent receptor domain-containing protein n=1 Tax=Hyphomonas sp. TaxID=87 RepID=UPI00391D4A2E